MPGVVPTVSGLPYYYVRGAPPSAVGYFVDDVRVPYLFHFALGPSVIHPALIDEVSLHPAAFPGRYGRFAGAIVAGKTREAPTELRGEGNVRLFDAGAFAEAPFADGRASVGLGGRFSYTGPLFSVFAPDTSVEYRDYNARASYAVDDRWRLSLLSFGAYDLASQMEPRYDGVKEENVLFASEFHRIDLRADRRGDDGAESRVGVTFGIDRTRIDARRFAQDVMVALRGRHLARVTSQLSVEAGIDATVDRFTGDLPSPWAVSPSEYQELSTFFSPRTETSAGAWLSGAWRWQGGVRMVATARADVFTSAGEIAVGPSPRIAAHVPLDRKTRFLAAMGTATQRPAFAIPLPAVGYRGFPGGLTYGWQKSATIERDLPLEITARATGFHHSYFNQHDLGRPRAGFELELPLPVPSAPTQAYGLELQLNRRLSKRIGAFVSYTLSRAEVGSTERQRSRVSPFDRTHVLQFGVAANVYRGWHLSGRLLTYSGWSQVAGTTDPNEDERLPAFWRVDARVEHRWSLGTTGRLSLVLEALNASAQTEIVSRSCARNGACVLHELGPVVAPSIGLEGAL